jgi:hypothetical protein
MCRIHCVQVIGRLKNFILNEPLVGLAATLDNNINKLILHKTKIH